MTTQHELWPGDILGEWPTLRRSLTSSRDKRIGRKSSFHHRRHLYPIEWKEIARSLKEAADWTCMECGRQCRRPDEAWDGDQRRTLTCAHVWPADHAPDHPVVCVLCLCAPCHIRFDAERRGYARRWGEPGRMVYGWVQLALF